MERYDGNQSDANLMISEFMLSPDIPETEKEYFNQYKMLFDKLMALGNIKSWYTLSFLAGYQEVVILLNLGLYQKARERMGKQLTKMQLSRSYDGFQTLYGQHGIERREEVRRVVGDTQKKSSFFSMFRKKKQEQPRQEPGMGVGEE